jgi:N-acetylglucosaminyl-diphospho-decaprenol L-rhamnosyltransferase
MPARMSRVPAGALSVVIVTYNSAAAVRATLAALCPQLRPGDELVVVDNGSVDATLTTVRQIAPDAVVIESPGNVGFAAGANAGARAARGELLVILNPDAVPAAGFVEAIRAPRGDWAAWMGLVRAGAGVNSSGGILHFTGIAWAGQAAPAGPREVAFLSGACLALPRASFLDANGFAEPYFMYQEDVDLSLRLRLTGGRLGIEPAAAVDHDYEFAKGPDKWRLLERNRWSTIVRCYPGGLLALLVPALVATELALLVVAAAGGWLPQKLAAMRETGRALPRLLRERRAIQTGRTISAADFAAALTPDLDSPFLGRAGRSRLLRRLLRGYWRLVLAALR